MRKIRPRDGVPSSVPLLLSCPDRLQIVFPELHVHAQMGLAFYSPNLRSLEAYRVNRLGRWVFGVSLLILDGMEAVHSLDHAPLPANVARQAIVAETADVYGGPR